jgi:general secretion pathway protein K
MLTAMIIVVLVVTLSASMVWQQWRAVQVEMAERARSQSTWVLAGALDWTRMILREDARANIAGAGPVDHLGEVWATPLAEARLSTFLAADKNNTDTGPEAFLSGSIVDAQARFNVTNLVMASNITKLNLDELAIFDRLCQNLGAGPTVALQIANGMKNAMGQTNSENASLLPRSVAQLSWLGVDSTQLALLAPYVVVLPQVTTINVNTASAEVLVAAIVGNDAATAQRLVQYRQRVPFKTQGEFAQQVPSLTVPNSSLSVNSNFFVVQGRLRLNERVLEETSLINRVSANEITVVHRERASRRENSQAFP